MTGTISLTFDTDHMSEARMETFLRTFDRPGRGVMSCTQSYNSVDEVAHELAPHPYLPEGADWDRELNSKREMFPNAVGWRSHGCVYSQTLAVRLAREDYLYASANEALGSVGLTPLYGSWGMLQTPIYYMDSCDGSRSVFWPKSNHRPFDAALIDRALEADGLFIFDFHPVHLLLNSPDPHYYLTRRLAFVEGAPLRDLVYPGRGVATFFNELRSAMRAERRVSTALNSVV